jgi:hypothetical protein
MILACGQGVVMWCTNDTVLGVREMMGWDVLM